MQIQKESKSANELTIPKRETKQILDSPVIGNRIISTTSSFNIDSNRDKNSLLQRTCLVNCRSVSEFNKVLEIGEGTYGQVCKSDNLDKAIDKRTNEVVALKKIRMDLDSEGFPITALREIKILQETSHPNIIKLKEVCVGYKQDSIFLVFEYCETDLVNLLSTMRDRSVALKLAEIKAIMVQLLKGVSYLHGSFIVHRDLKLSNILLNKEGRVKLADFGLSRYLAYPVLNQYTPRMVTLWYRAPEILLNLDYDWRCDVWALGCILGELLCQGKPLMPGKSEVGQFDEICDLIGFPAETAWPEFFRLEKAKKLMERARNENNWLEKKFKKFSPACVDLLSSMLRWNPLERVSASEALLHEFFSEYPYPCRLNDLSRDFCK